MPKPRLLRIDFSADELREISIALGDQLATLVRLDAAAYREHINVTQTALAKALHCIGQRPGDKCFLCRKPISVGDGAVGGRCPNGCEPPGSWLLTQGQNASVH
jgi:hypothetical protein